MATSPDRQKDIGSGSFVAKKRTDLNNTTVFQPYIDLVNRHPPYLLGMSPISAKFFHIGLINFIRPIGFVIKETAWVAGHWAGISN
jgi:hypothetical protein